MPIDPVTSSSLGLSPLVPARPTRPAAGTPFAEALDDAGAGAARAARPVPEAPPPQALEAVQVAERVYEHMRAADRRLHFERTPHGVRIDVYDGAGRLIQRVPPTEVVQLAAAEKTWLA